MGSSDDHSIYGFDASVLIYGIGVGFRSGFGNFIRCMILNLTESGVQNNVGHRLLWHVCIFCVSLFNA